MQSKREAVRGLLTPGLVVRISADYEESFGSFRLGCRRDSGTLTWVEMDKEGKEKRVIGRELFEDLSEVQLDKIYLKATGRPWIDGESGIV